MQVERAPLPVSSRQHWSEFGSWSDLVPRAFCRKSHHDGLKGQCEQALYIHHLLSSQQPCKVDSTAFVLQIPKLGHFQTIL